MRTALGFFMALALCASASLSYFIFCPHAGRNHKITEVHLHVVPMGPGVLKQREKDEPPSVAPNKLEVELP